MYRIIRFRRKSNTRPRVIKRGLTLEQAQAHCSRADTSGPKVECGLCGRRNQSRPERCSYCGGFMVSDWFDGYEES